MTTVELIPTNGRKSFGGKAFIKIDDNGNQTLLSYGVAIIRKDKKGKLHRLWGGWSQTTGTHISSFCGLHKKEFTSMPVEIEK